MHVRMWYVGMLGGEARTHAPTSSVDPHDPQIAPTNLPTWVLCMTSLGELKQLGSLGAQYSARFARSLACMHAWLVARSLGWRQVAAG